MSKANTTNDHVIGIINGASFDNAEASEFVQDPKSELDSHANMVVLGRNCFIFEWSGQTCNIMPFTKTLGTVQYVPIVDAAIAYDCPYQFETYILLIWIVLYLPTLENNFIPPFIMREGGVIVNDKAKIHCDNPTVDDHCIKFYNSDLSIPLKLDGTFSFFHSQKPMDDELQSCDKVIIFPDNSCWNPYCKSLSLNEESMLDYNGEMADKSRHTNYLMDVDDNDGVVASVAISEYDEAVDHVMMETFDYVPCDEAISDDDKFLDAISERAEVSKVMGTIGSVRTCGVPCNLFDDPIGGTIDELR